MNSLHLQTSHGKKIKAASILIAADMFLLLKTALLLLLILLTSLLFIVYLLLLASVLLNQVSLASFPATNMLFMHVVCCRNWGPCFC